MLVCEMCNDQFESIDILVRHIKVKHNFQDIFSCNKYSCGRSFHTLLAYKRHLQLTHRAEEMVTPCTFDRKAEKNTNVTNIESGGIRIDQNQSIENTNTSSQPYCIKDNATLFVSKLYNNYSLPRSLIQNIVCDVSELIRKPLDMLKTAIDSFDLDDENNSSAGDIINSFRNMFSHLSSEYLRVEHFKSFGSFVEPITIVIGQRIDDKKRGTRVVLEFKDTTIQYIPIHKTLKLFLELPNVFESICTYMKQVQSSSALISIMQGTIWRDIINSFGQRLVMPIYLYSDDFEIGNPLGSHAGIYKICGIYVALGCIPPEYSSQLDNIFLAQLCYASDVKTSGIDKIFEKIIQDLTSLENIGLDITISGFSHTVHFKLVLLLGDNLGMHTMLGLTESFNSEYFCRFCRCNKQESREQIFEHSEQLRTKENYETDLKNTNYGVKVPCVWHKLPNFHLTINSSCDIMHDIWEGVCRYDLGNLLHHFIYKEKYFNLDQLNNRIRFFNYLDKNKPPTIPKSQILNKHIIMSASEMSSLVQNLSLIIGDYIPVNDPVWDIYISLYEIIEIINSKAIHPKDVELLKTLIVEHHSLYLKHFGKLKPKYHFMVHYPNLISKIGPLVNVSSMRFEAKHRQFKNAARNTTSRVNILYTLSIKNQLAFSHRILAQNGFTCAIYETGSLIMDFQNSPDYNVFCKYVHFNMPDEYLVTTSIKANGNKYNVDSVLSIDVQDFIPIFGIITSIITSGNAVYFILNELRTVIFNEHVHSYEVEKTNNLVCKQWSELYFAIPTNLVILNQKYYVI